MTDAAATPPEGGWADTPRPPVTVTLTEEQARRLIEATVRGSEVRPMALRLVVALVLAVLLAVTRNPFVGIVAGAVLAGLAAALFVLRRRAIEATAKPGSGRTTGYDHDGSFVVTGPQHTVLPRGWAAHVERRDGVVLLRSRTRGARLVVLPDELLTPADEAVLRTPPVSD